MKKFFPMIALLAFVSACDKVSAKFNDSEKCADSSVYETVKNIVFDKVENTNSDNPLKINDWKKSFLTTVNMPALSGVDKQINKVSCTGRLTFTIPQEERKFFNGETELKADITYSIQPSADKSGNIISVDGVEYIVSDIVEANGRAIGMKTAGIINAQQAAEQAKAEQIASAGGPQIAQTYNPSFDCGRSLTNTERMICQDEGLASLDRELSTMFKTKLSSYDNAQKQTLLAIQRKNLSIRAKCPDTSCLYDWYSKNKEWVSTIN